MSLKKNELLFPKQLAFMRDPAPFKTAVCSRRSGKTVVCAFHLLLSAYLNAGTISLYITLSRNNAKKIIWPLIKFYNRVFKLKGNPNETDLSLTLPNGSVVYCSGAKDKVAIENFRGLPLKLCYIDECQSFPGYLESLIDDVIAPALLDYAGTLCLIGTPGPIPAGYFHKCAHQDTWSHHAWTFFDNPFIAAKAQMPHQALLERELKRRGVTVENPTIQREFFGKWILDSDSLLIHYNPLVNHFDKLPGNPNIYSYLMGIDLGFNDADALAILAWSDSEPTTYLVDELITPNQGITELVTQIQAMGKKYVLAKMVMDEGALGKKIGEEIRRQHGIPVHGADKKLKMQNVAFLNDALRTGRFKARKDSRFAQDSYLVEIDREKSTPERIRIHTRYHSDIIDAALYGFKESPAFAFQVPKEPTPKGTPKWNDEEQERMFEEAQAFFKKEDY